MRVVGLMLVIFGAFVGRVCAQEGPAAAPAGVNLEQVAPAAIVGQARAAMLEYLKERTPADKQKLLPDLLGLQSIRHGAAVGIRIDGQLKAQAFAGGGEFCRNVMAAAIKALRSPSLPDRVTAELVRSAAIEVESIESLQPISPREIPKNYVPGLTGLLLKAPGDASTSQSQASRPATGAAPASLEAWSLPSAAYEYSLTATQAMARCQGQLPSSQVPSGQWSTFVGRHYVGYADGQALRLFRGKALAPEKSDAATRFLLAGQIGLYLQAHQDKDGCFRTAAGRGTLAEHLYAAYAMARLSAATGLRYDAMPAIQYAQGLAKKADDLTYLAGEQPQDQLLAAALYILVSEECGLKKDDLRDALAKTIAARMELPALPGRLDGTSPQAASRVALYVASRAMADKPSKAAKLLRERAQTALPDSPVAALWKGWSGLDASRAPAEAALTACRSILPDEKGALCGPKDSTPRTFLPAMAALSLSKEIEQLRKGDKARNGPKVLGLLEQLDGLQAFCQRMTYQPGEAYFAADPSEWVGAVRTDPASAQVDLASCAAVIECLLLP